jgi:hypothetical protein
MMPIVKFGVGLTHISVLYAPGKPVISPVPHGVHEDAPSMSEYVSCGHSMQLVPVVVAE